MRWRLALMVFSGIGALLFLILTAATGPRVRKTEPPRLAMSAALSASADVVTPSARISAVPFPAGKQPAAMPGPLSVERTAPAARASSPSLENLALRISPQLTPVEAVDARPSDEYGVYREAVAMVTAYCPCARCCGSFANGRTSTGASAWRPGLAAAPLALPYGTRVFVPGYGVSAVDDTGGAMRRSWQVRGQLHIDVRMNYHHEARVWGVQYLHVRIYDHDTP